MYTVIVFSEDHLTNQRYDQICPLFNSSRLHDYYECCAQRT